MDGRYLCFLPRYPLLPAGALGDRYGRRRMLLMGIFILGVANAATLLTSDVSLVITSRAVSGVGAALIFPATLSTITTTLPEGKRVKGVAIWTASVFLAACLECLSQGRSWRTTGGGASSSQCRSSLGQSSFCAGLICLTLPIQTKPTWTH